jgi:hypothetical protein
VFAATRLTHTIIVCLHESRGSLESPDYLPPPPSPQAQLNMFTALEGCEGGLGCNPVEVQVDGNVEVHAVRYQVLGTASHFPSVSNVNRRI